MNAFLFTLVIFAFWALVGFAVLLLFNPRIRVLQGILVSSAVGVATTIIPLFVINRMGLPVKDFASTLVVVLALGSVFIISHKRPFFPVKATLPFIAILITALTLAGRPMFSYGFDWVSFSNDDMANYSLGAQRFLNHGFFDLPDLDDLFSGKDYSLAYWFMHVPGKSRAGSELMLAAVWAVSGLNAHQIFMPVIMALHLALISGAGAMVVGAGKTSRTTLIAMGLLSLSPLTTLGALYQLIGQVGGLALLSAAVTLMYRPVKFRGAIEFLITNMPAALILAGIFIWYPEVLPFFGLGWIVYSCLFIGVRKRNVLLVVLPAAIVGLLVLFALNKYVISALLFMLNQASGGMQAADLSTVLFPYFLVPSGIAAFWGLIPIAGDIREPFVSIAIAVGFIVFYWLLRFVLLKQIKLAGAPVSIFLVMLAMGLFLFFRNNDFGLFKLAMFAQPFLICVVATELGELSWNRSSLYTKIAIPIFLIPLAVSQYGYVGKSTGEIFGGLNEIPRASAQKVNRQFDQMFQSLRNNNPNGFIADTSNIVLAKFQSLYTQGKSLLFPSRNFYINIADFYVDNGRMNGGIGVRYEENRNKSFVEHKIKSGGITNTFFFPQQASSELSDRTLITTQEKQTIFNASHSGESLGYFKFVQAPVNHLVFVHSDLGNHYYFGDRKKISFYQLENDPMFHGQKFSALGEHLLFFVLSPTAKPRLVMELSDTVVKQFGSELPRPRVQNTSMNFVGRGSGRVISNPILPEVIDGVPFVSIDMSRSGRQFPNLNKGLMMLYGREIPADQRRITAFGRDISLISEEQYLAILPPVNLKTFPADLANKNLEYSGIYEDGWISEKSFFVLSPESSSRFIKVSGSVPHIGNSNFSTVLQLSVNGEVVGSQRLGLGDFELKIPVTSLSPKQRIDIEFSDYQTLPGADGRIAPAKINFIGFE